VLGLPAAAKGLFENLSAAANITRLAIEFRGATTAYVCETCHYFPPKERQFSN
jgi:hypothetical protein